MQSGDQIRETLTSALGPSLSRKDSIRGLGDTGFFTAKDYSAKTSSKNSFTLSEEDTTRVSLGFKNRETSIEKNKINTQNSQIA